MLAVTNYCSCRFTSVMDYFDHIDTYTHRRRIVEKSASYINKMRGYGIGHVTCINIHVYTTNEWVWSHIRGPSLCPSLNLDRCCLSKIAGFLSTCHTKAVGFVHHPIHYLQWHTHRPSTVTLAAHAHWGLITVEIHMQVSFHVVTIMWHMVCVTMPIT